ncbi:MAG: endonuclease [Muribaculaceae bacterium]|nr:endonuclease [Muribaculaceae bacterium]
MKHQLILTLAAAAAVMPALSATPDYSVLNGLKGAALKNAVKQLALPHTEIAYGDATWEVFAHSDVRVIGGREAWFDMYSNRIVYVTNGHAALNIEHSVANSWWGGKKNAAYKDLHHLNPSDADANGRKSNNPLGVISGSPTWSNGVTTIGRPTSATGGGSSTVFEPADEYKGDFARAYFYIFTLYDDISWADTPAYMYDRSSYPTLKPWAYEMLLEWAAADPVDEREVQRNASVAEFQKNENPFISIPGLAEYVWGSKKNTPFDLQDAMTAPLPNRPDAPEFGDYYLAGVNTWTGRWWNSFDLYLTAPEGCDIYYAIGDSNSWTLSNGVVTVPAAKASGETYTIRAYSVDPTDPSRPGSTATLTLTAVEEGVTDYMHAKWTKVTSASEINADDLYVILSEKANAVMSTTTGMTSSSGYLSVAGNVEPENGEINVLPEGSAVVRLVSSGGGQYYVQVNSLALEPAGYIAPIEAKKIQLSEQGMPAQVKLGPEGNVVVNFGSTYGNLQYNSSSPRFSCYTSSQEKIGLYRCVENHDVSGVAPVVVSAESATRIFTLQGVEVGASLEQLPAGIYVVVKDGSARKVVRH